MKNSYLQDPIYNLYITKSNTQACISQALRSLSLKKLTNSKCLMKTTSIYYFSKEDSTLESHALATQVYGL